MNINKCVSNAIAAAIEAGKAILQIYETDFSVEYKADKSPLTLADMKSHSIIKQFLTRGEGSFPFLSEEGRDIPFHERKKWDILWIVDPLDGTKEFVKRNGEFTVNIALVKGTKPIAGVIYSPVLDKLYFASEEIGAYMVADTCSHVDSLAEPHNKLLDDMMGYAEKLPLKNQQEKDETFYVVASRSHFSSETKEYVDSLKNQYSHIELISAGSSLKMCLVAEGKARLYPRFAPTMEWDTAAGHAIVEASGGSVVRYDSEKALVYNKEDLVNPWFIVKGNG